MATYPTLGMNRNNDKNEVIKLQNALTEEGFSVGSTGADGIYGPKTAQAVQAYQQKNQLQVDGIAGPQTLGHLYSQSAQETAPAVQDTTPTAQPQPAPSAVETARTALDQHMQNKPAQTDSQWKKALDDLYEQITNQGDFTYDVNADALYQQYRDLYTAQGNLAMQDTMAQASALTGGYGNSYAQAVGQQAYNSYLQQLNAVVPELYGMAYDRYNQAQQDLYNQASLAATLYDQEFNAYQTALSDWQTERAYLMDADNTAYSRQQDAKNELLTLMTTTGYTPTDEELAATGMTRAQAQAWGSYYSGNTGTSQGTSQTGGDIDRWHNRFKDAKHMEELYYFADLMEAEGFNPTVVATMFEYWEKKLFDSIVGENGFTSANGPVIYTGKGNNAGAAGKHGIMIQKM